MTLYKFIKHLEKNNLLLRRRDVLGEFLAEGIHRRVYVCKIDPRYVVKIEPSMIAGDFANVMEWRFWIDNKEWKDLSKWLAPCEIISQDGRILIQRRVQFYMSREYPERIPSLFTDLKKGNYGWIGKQLVCCDYPFTLMNNHSLRLKKIKWIESWQ